MKDYAEHSRHIAAQARRYRRQVQVLRLLKQAWEMRPNSRLCKLLVEVLKTEHPDECRPYFVEDTILEKRLEEFIG